MKIRQDYLVLKYTYHTLFQSHSVFLFYILQVLSVNSFEGCFNKQSTHSVDIYITVLILTTLQHEGSVYRSTGLYR